MMAMGFGSTFVRRSLVACVVIAAALCAAAGIAFLGLAAGAHRYRPQAGWASLEPPRIDFWDRVDLLLFRGRAANARAGGARAGSPGARGTAAVRGSGRRPTPAAAAAAATAAPDPYQETADADQRDLAAALSGLPLPEERRRALLADYRRLRQAWLGTDEAAAAARGASPAGLDLDPASAVVPAVPRRVPAGGLALPAGLPTEFAVYLEGAFAYRNGDLAAARACWQQLLALPAEARRYRSTWAAFMLGRVALRVTPRDLDAAVGWFRRTRELAARGCVDSLGLTAASLGWEAQAEAARQRFDRAEALYAQQARAGDASAVDSLRILWRERLVRGFLGR